MKRFLIIIFVLILVFCVTGCDSDKNENENINVSQYKLYIDTTEHWDISTSNGYKCISMDNSKDDDGVYTVTFKFKQINSEVTK